MKTTKKNTQIKVSGKLLTKDNKAAKGQTVTVTINGKKYTAKTYSSGYFTVNYKATKTGTNNIKFTYNGGNLYLASSNTNKFTVKA